MKKTIHLFGILMLMLPFVSSAQTCNWKARNPVLSAWDSCYSSSNQIIAVITFNGFTSGQYPCEWKVNGVITGNNAPILQHNVSSNNIYSICVKVRDTINNCDTTFCLNTVVDCIQCNNWKSKISRFYVNDTCDQYPGKLYNRIDGVIRWINMSDKSYNQLYKYKWTINSKPLTSAQGSHITLPNGNYTICLTIRDTINNCDTTLCKSVTVNCQPCVSWSKRIQSLRIFDTCSQYDKMLKGEVKLENYSNVIFKWSIPNFNSKLYQDNVKNYTYYPGSNGTYTVCLKMTDTMKNCDTTICKTINFQCLNACNWWDQKMFLFIRDSCKGQRQNTNMLHGNLYINNNNVSQYRYLWKLNGVTMPEKSGTFKFPLTQNGTYTVCVEVHDTFNNCDTILCQKYSINCPLPCTWKNKIKHFYVNDSCVSNFNGITSKIYFDSSGLSNNYQLKWYVNNKFIKYGNNFMQSVDSNGNFSICLNIYDTIKKCDTTICQIVTVDCFKVGNPGILSDQKPFFVYPNPASDIIEFHYSSVGFLYQIYDAHGRVLKSGKTQEGINEVHIEDMSDGVYWISIQDSNCLKTCKLIISR